MPFVSISFANEEEEAALATACSSVRSLSDGGSGLDSESAPSQSHACSSDSVRERGEEESKLSFPLLLLLSFSSGRKAWDFMPYLDFCPQLSAHFNGPKERLEKDVILTHFRSEFRNWPTSFKSQGRLKSWPRFMPRRERRSARHTRVTPPSNTGGT